MRRILLPLLLIVVLSGCETTGNALSTTTATPDRTEVTEQTVEAAKQGVIGSEFNPVEYMLFAQIEAKARLAKAYCGQPAEVVVRMKEIETVTEVLVTHSAYLPNNKETTEIALILRKNIGEFIDRYESEATREATPSERYCERKMDLYLAGIRRALEAVGAKVRR